MTQTHWLLSALSALCVLPHAPPSIPEPPYWTIESRQLPVSRSANQRRRTYGLLWPAEYTSTASPSRELIVALWFLYPWLLKQNWVIAINRWKRSCSRGLTKKKKMKEIIVLQNGNPVSVFIIQKRLNTIGRIEGQIRSAEWRIFYCWNYTILKKNNASNNLSLVKFAFLRQQCKNN